MFNISNTAFLTFFYFIQGLPYGLQTQFLPIYLHSKSISASKIGFLRFLYIPWLFKFIWGPLVDSFSSKRKWLCVTNFLLCLVCVAGSFVSPHNLVVVAVVLFLLNLLTSIQDVAVDATTVSLLNAEEMALGSIAQVVGYKLGSIFSGGILSSFIDAIEWTVLFLIIGVFYLEAALFAFLSPTLRSYERKEFSKKNSKSHHDHDHHHHCSHSHSNDHKQDHTREESNSPNEVRRQIVKVFSDHDTVWMMVFLFVYKLGEQGALSMLPLYLLDKGMSSDDVTFWFNLIGQSISIIGSLVGSALVKYTVKKIPIEFLLQQICLLRLLPIGGQLLMIILWNDISTDMFLYISVISNQILLLLSGIVTTTTFTMMMQMSKKVPTQIQATHYATMSTVEVLGKLMFASVSGCIVDTMGYEIAFFLFVVLSVLVLPVFNRVITRNDDGEKRRSCDFDSTNSDESCKKQDGGNIYSNNNFSGGDDDENKSFVHDNDDDDVDGKKSN